jgi:hypothetical protein
MPDSKKIPLEEEKERYGEFLNELTTLSQEYSLENEKQLNILKESISRFLRRFVSEEDQREFEKKTRLFFVIGSNETQSERAKRRASWYHSLYSDIQTYLESSLKAISYALKTDYIRAGSDSERRGIVLDRKAKGSQIETIDSLRIENKRLRKELSQSRNTKNSENVLP